MNRLLTLAAAAAILLPGLAGPTFAQTLKDYGTGDICKRAAGRPVLQCREYPRGITYHRPNCRWVEETYEGQLHGFELCRDKGGAWRPSGRG